MFAQLKEKFTSIVGSVSNLAGETKLIGNNDEQIKLLRKLFDHHALSKFLPYESYDKDADLYINKNSAGFVLEATPLLGSNDEVENILSGMLTDMLPPNIDLQFLLWGSPKIGPMLADFEDTQKAGDIYKWLASKRTEYLKKGAFNSLSKSSSLVLRDFRLFIAVSMPDKINDHKEELIGLRDQIQSALGSVNIRTLNMIPQHFIAVFSDLITPTQNIMPIDDIWDELNPLSTQLTNSEWCLDVNPNSLEFISEDERVTSVSLNVAKFPKRSTQWQVGENLGQLFNSALQIPCPFAISFCIRKLDPEKTSADLELKSLNTEGEAKNARSRFNPLASQAREDWQFVRNRLAEGDALVKTFYQITLFGSEKEIKRHEIKVRNLYRANSWKLRKESYLQLQTWFSLFPFMMTEGLYSDLNVFNRLRRMTAFNAVCIAPLQGEWKGTRTHGMLLAGRRGQLASWSPFDKAADNYNIAVAAKTGGGKSVFVQEYIRSILGQNGIVWVIDMGRSYEKTCKLLGGEFIEFRPERPICLNPFTNVGNIQESLKVLVPLIASMARSKQGGASEVELTFIEKAIISAWEVYGNDTTITNVVEYLEKPTNNRKDDEYSHDLATALYRFTRDGSYGQYFEGKSSIDLTKQFIVLELQELKDQPDLQKIVLLLLIHQINNTMYLTERSRYKSCIIDEAWALLNEDNIQAAKFIEHGYRTARRFNGNFVTITQDVMTYYASTMAQAAFNCSNFKIILGQEDSAIEDMKNKNILIKDGFTERLFKSLRRTDDYSECVIITSDGITVHRLILDPFGRTLYSTKGDEFEAVKGLEKNMPLIDAVEQVARHFYYV